MKDLGIAGLAAAYRGEAEQLEKDGKKNAAP
jgi:hypothetical protein